MLKKLMKYDIYKMIKVLLVFYIASIICASISRIFVDLGKSMAFFKIMGIIFSSLEYTIIGNIIVNTFVRIILRFNMNFYKDESYLTHTLPVSKSKLLLSKYLSALVVIISSVFVTVVSLLIMFYSKQNMEFISTILNTTLNGNISVLLIVILTIICLMLEICAIMSMSFAGIVIGNRYNQKRALKSLLWIFIFYMCCTIDTALTIIIVSLISGNLTNLFSNTMTSSMLLMVLIVGILIYALYAILLYFIAKWQFEKGVNVD